MSRKNISVTNPKVKAIMDSAPNASKLIEDAILAYISNESSSKSQQAMDEFNMTQFLGQIELLKKQANIIHQLSKTLETNISKLSLDLLVSNNPISKESLFEGLDFKNLKEDE